MPQIAPWLTPAKPAPYYLQGVGLGLRAAEQRQAAAQRQAALAAQMAAQQREAEMQAARMAVQEELGRQELALKQQEMGMAAEQMAAKRQLQDTEIAQSLALRKAQDEYRARVAAGADPLTAMAQVAPFEEAAQALAIRQRMEEAAMKQRPTMPGGGPLEVSPISLRGKELGGWFAAPSATGAGITVHQVQPTIRPEVLAGLELRRQDLVAKIQDKIDKLVENNPDLTSDTAPTFERRKRAWDAGRKSIEKLQKQIDEIRASAVPGQTQRPVMRWNPETGKLEKSTTRTSLADISATMPEGVTTDQYPEWPTGEEEW